MNPPRSLQVDLADRKDISAKLPEAERVLALMEQELEEKQRDIDSWRDLVGVLRGIVGKEAHGNAHVPQSAPPSAPAPALPQSYSPMQDLVVGIVERENREIKAKEVAQILRSEGHELASDSISSALWQASKDDKRIRRLGRGLYAPLIREDTPDQAPTQATQYRNTLATSVSHPVAWAEGIVIG
jgi:hypothetical protein